MQYLVMHKFKSYGIWYHKGDMVDESLIRNASLRVSEGKLVAYTPPKQAVSSSSIPAAVLLNETQQENIEKVEPAINTEPVPVLDLEAEPKVAIKTIVGRKYFNKQK